MSEFLSIFESIPQEHIDLALEVEREVPEEEAELYLRSMNNKPMSQRDFENEQEIRDGCILTHSVYLVASETHPMKP